MSSPGSLALVVTAKPSLQRNGQANPVNRFDVGLLRLGTAHGYLPSFPVDADSQLIPCPAGITTVGYALFSGTTITLEERPEVLGQTVIDSVTPAIESTIISTASKHAAGGSIQTVMGAAGGGTSQVANSAMLVPFVVEAAHTVHRMFVYTTTGGGANHYDLGVYSKALARLASTGSTLTVAGLGSIALSGGDLALAAGEYYLGFAVDSATPVFVSGSLSIARLALAGVKYMTTAFPLPATFVPIAQAASSVPWFGFTADATP